MPLHAAQQAAVLESGAVERQDSADQGSAEEPVSLPGRSNGAVDTSASVDGTVMVTFRFPGALDGQDVSVIGDDLTYVPLVQRDLVLVNDSTAATCKDADDSHLHVWCCPSGSFCKWDEPIALRRSPETNDFVRSMAMAPGTIQASDAYGTAHLLSRAYVPACALCGGPCSVSGRHQSQLD